MFQGIFLYMKNILKKYWPIGIIFLLEGILFNANFTQGTWLVGWDNMMPEFDFTLNFKRAFFSVWQEYRGLGLMDGMSHAANLVHYSIMYLLSFMFPTNILRYIYVFGTHVIGGIGMYILISQYVLCDTKHKSHQIIALIGALFYQYCFATIQTYYLPFEVFITHFAFFPWLIYSALRLLQNVNRKNIAIFSLVSFLATTQAHVPTVFIVYEGTLGFLLLTNLLQTRFRSVKTVFLIVILTITTNAFWGLPFAYGTLSQAKAITISKNNQTSTEDTYEKNHIFGDVSNTALMRSFALTYNQYDHVQHRTTLMMEPWINAINNPWVTTAQWILFGLTIVGILGSIITKQKKLYPFVILYLLIFSIIGNDIPILRIIPELLRTYVPLFADVFRFVFTKFFVIYALLSSLFFSYGVYIILSFIKSKYLNIIITLVIVSILGITTYPSFTGNFIHKNLRVIIPDEYFKTFAYFQEQDPNKRILILPAPWFWAWTQYQWGTIGSGFIWFGIPQALVDRAFDPWSPKNENLYWELSQITYQGDAEQFNKLLDKYDISYIVFDDQIMHPVNDKALYVDSLFSMISKVSSTETKFGRISIFSVNNSSHSSGVSLTGQLPNVGPIYTWNDRDQAYYDIGNYMTDSSKAYNILYPFRSLFTGRTQDEIAFTVSQNDTQLTLASKETTIPTKSITFDKTIVYDSTLSGILEKPIQRCDAKTDGSIKTQNNVDGSIIVSTVNATACIDVYLPDISQRDGYLLQIDTKNNQGKPVYVSITNKDTKRTFLETELPKYTQLNSSYLVIPPMNEYGMGYSINLNTISLGRDKSINTISRIVVYQIPYEEMVRSTDTSNSLNMLNVPEEMLNFEHPNPAFYKVAVQQNLNTAEETLILNQAYYSGWRAYEIINQNSEAQRWISEMFPYIFGKEIKNHVLVNNWENGWILDTSHTSNSNNQTIVLFFLPQLLQYIGFALLPIPFLFLLKKR